MGLLSEADYRVIRDAVKLTTDTFMRSDVAYKQSSGALDRWEEDKSAETFITHNFKALEEYPKLSTNAVNEDVNGNLDLNEVRLTVNLEDLEDMGLIDADYKHMFTAETDYFTLKGQLYRVTDIYTDGPLSEKPVLLIITGKLADKKIA